MQSVAATMVTVDYANQNNILLLP